MKFGLHISSQEAINSGWVQKFNKSPVHLVLAPRVTDNIQRTLDVAELCPNSLIVYRAYDYGIAKSDHFEDYYTKFGTNPNPLIDAHQPCFDAFKGRRLTYQFFNETGHDLWPYFIEFNTRLIKEMDRRGLSASVLGLGPGYPKGTQAEILNKWQTARPMFEAINTATHQHYVNLHEYFGYPVINYFPFLIGRYGWMLDNLFAMGVLTDKIKIIIGESSWADPSALNLHEPPNPANGYRGYLMNSITPQQLADDLVNEYSIYGSPHVIGTCHFCCGDSGGWADFDLLNEPSILQRIYDNMASELVIIDTEPIDFIVTIPVLNVRSYPSTQNAKLATLTENTQVKTNGYVENDGYRWRRLVAGGWCAEIRLLDNEPYMRLVPEVDWKTQAKLEIKLIREALDTLTELIETN